MEEERKCSLPLNSTNVKITPLEFYFFFQDPKSIAVRQSAAHIEMSAERRQQIGALRITINPPYIAASL